MNEIQQIFDAEAILKSDDAGPEAIKIAVATIAALAPDVIRLLQAEVVKLRREK